MKLWRFFFPKRDDSIRWRKNAVDAAYQAFMRTVAEYWGAMLTRCNEQPKLLEPERIHHADFRRSSR